MAASDTAVAHRMRTTKTTVAKRRGQFVERRLEGLYDEPRVGAPRTISDEQAKRSSTACGDSAFAFSRCMVNDSTYPRNHGPGD
jgi:transposase